MNYQPQNCRVCLKNVKNSYNLTELMTTDETFNISYESAFVECTGFVVESSEPQKICKFCAGELKIAFSFREKCKKTQDELGNCFKIEEIQIKSEFNDEGYELQCLQNVEISQAKPTKTNQQNKQKNSKTLPSNKRKQKQTTKNTERYFCDLCASSYTLRKHLKSHYDLKHSDQKRYQCPRCDSHHSIQLLKLHLQYKHRVNPENIDLEVEKSDAETNDRYKCDLCQKLYMKREYLKDHYSAKHADEEMHQCPYCDYKNALQMFNLHLLFKHKMKTKSNIQYVMNGKSSDTSLSQNASENELKSSKRNENDVKRENSENVTNNSNQDISLDQPSCPRIKCDICENTYTKKGHLKDHYITKHAGQETCECEYCGEKCFSQYLESHIFYCKMRPKSVIVSLPRNQRPLTLCPVCGELKSKEHISKHVSGKQKEEIYICDLCGKTIKCKNTLYQHMQEKHLKILYECHYCYMKLSRKADRVHHERKFHPEIKGVLKCPSCDYTALSNNALRIHKQRHDPQTFNRCQICFKDFISERSLKNHMKTHSDVKAFACEICGASFAVMKYLRRHRKQHEEPDYECPVCSKTFVTNQLMRKHIEKQHPEYPLPPPGTIMAKKRRRHLAEKHLKEEAMRQGFDLEVVEKIVVTEAPPIEEMQFTHPFE